MLEDLKYRALLELTACELSKSVDRHMPIHDYQHYYAWGLSSQNIHRHKWIDLIGLSQLTHLTGRLLNQSEITSYWPSLMSSSIAMNIYQIYEIVSDNLAIGLARSEPENNLRRDVLLHFNEVMISRLAGDLTPTTQLLSSSYDNIQTISTFEQSLSLSKHQDMARLYLMDCPVSSLPTLEHATWPLLVANIEACVELAAISDQHLVGPMVRQGLLKRYQAVNRLLRRIPQSLEEQIATSADAILVLPTLAYYMGVLGEKVVSPTCFSGVIDDTSLYNALYGAAVLVRLLNDLGVVVTLSSQERASLLRQLRASAQQGADPTLSALLLRTADQFGPIFTRIHKDAQFGEFNLALNDLGHIEPNLTTLSEFEGLLDVLGETYMSHKHRLIQQLEHIDCVVGTRVLSRVIWHFVTFHEALYSQSHSTNTGEYAV